MEEWQTYFLGLQITVNGNCSHEIKRHVFLLWKAITNLDSIIKSRDIALLTKVWVAKAMVFPVVMYGCELGHKEGWVPKNWHFPTMVLEKTLESPLVRKEIKPVSPKEHQPWILTGRIVLKLKFQLCGHLMRRVDSLEKTLMLEKIEGRKRKGMTEDKIVGWHHQLNGHEFEQTPGKCEGQGNLVCYSPWGHNEWTGLSDRSTASFVCICAMRNNISLLQCNYTGTKVLVLVKIRKRENRKKFGKKINLTMLSN